MNKLLHGVLEYNTFNDTVIPTKAFSELSDGIVVPTFFSSLAPAETKTVIAAQRAGDRKRVLEAFEKAFKHVKLSKPTNDHGVRFLGIKVETDAPKALVCVVRAHKGESPVMTYSAVHLDGYLWLNPGAAAGSFVEILDA